MTLTIVHLLPELLGTYGDQGNVEILSWRLKQRQISHEVIVVTAGDKVPTQADLYLLGGGEDDAQIAAADLLNRGGALRKAHSNGAHFFAVCAGFQLIGSTFPASGNRTIEGLGLLPVETISATPRSVGELISTPTIDLPTLTGFENHSGQTRHLEDLQPLGNVTRGVGNGLDSGIDGAITDQVLATYMHGPAFARNPELADWILSRKLGPLEKIDAPIFTLLHDERIKNAK